MRPRAPAPTLQVLVADLVDYAGLFPPAALTMADAVAAYAGYLDSPASWMLGRFVVPVSRLDELAAEAARYVGAHADPWVLTAIFGEDVAGDMDRVTRSNVARTGRLHVDAVELKTTEAAGVRRAAEIIGHRATLYMEVPVADDPRELLRAVRDAGLRAKIRTGGVTPDAIPTAAHIARFIVQCAELGVAFKATAGLHHPVRGEYPLTYDEDAPRAQMFGFLNVFVAAAFALAGAAESTVAEILGEESPAGLRFDARVLRWRDRELSLEQLQDARTAFAISFGSCSFQEPVDDLHQLGLV